MIGVGEVDSLEKLAELNHDEIVEGYMAGADPAVPIGKSRSFYHGWLNAQVDHGRMKLSEAQRKLAADFALRSRS